MTSPKIICITPKIRFYFQALKLFILLEKHIKKKLQNILILNCILHIVCWFVLLIDYRPNWLVINNNIAII